MDPIPKYHKLSEGHKTITFILTYFNVLEYERDTILILEAIKRSNLNA